MSTVPESRGAESCGVQEEGRRMAWWLGLLLCAAGGTLTALAFVPFDLSMCVWVGLMPLVSVLWMGRRRRGFKGFLGAFGYGWVYGLFYFGTSFWWINEVSTLGYVPFMMYLAVYPALWAGLAGTWLRPRFEPFPEARDLPLEQRKARWSAWNVRDMAVTLRAVLGCSALWVVTEWLRGWVMTGFGWNGLGVALYSGLSMAQWAEFVGVTVLSFIPVMVNLWLWCVCRRVGGMMLKVGKRPIPWDFYALCVVLMMLFLGGMFLSLQYAPADFSKKGDASPHQTGELPVMAVQRNQTQREKSFTPPKVLYDDLLQATREGMESVYRGMLKATEKEGQVRVQMPAWVIWPESSLARSVLFDAETGNLLPDVFNQALLFGKGGVPALREDFGDFVLLTGGDLAYFDWQTRLPQKSYNALVAFEEDFDGMKDRRKQHLVPFGEYIPCRDIFPWLEDAFTHSAGFRMGSTFEKGDTVEPLPLRGALPGSKVGVIPAICYEDTVGRLLRRFVRPGNQVIVNVTNDGWFNQSFANEQHARNAAFRCIELRRPMVRASNTGMTVAYAPNGAVLDELRGEDGSPFVKGSLYARLPLDENAGYTLYALAGDWAVAACAVLVLLCGFLRLDVSGGSRRRG